MVLCNNYFSRPLSEQQNERLKWVEALCLATIQTKTLLFCQPTHNGVLPKVSMERSGLACFWVFLALLSMRGKAGSCSSTSVIVCCLLSVFPSGFDLYCLVLIASRAAAAGVRLAIG